ncbi:MAG: hypothetical protein IJ321_07980, partial [Alistipes sp.]|uniref:hypothetical protein n=1 Tax=Alistipes sp. TaxID=1872444 RepID=UPI0039773729|nr:hypothetical protein [Alistipes sp.]
MFFRLRPEKCLLCALGYSRPANLPLPSLIRTLAVPKILRLGKNASELAFFSRLIRIFGFAEDTPARQCSNKFDIALAYSHFGCAEDTPPRKKCKRTCFFLSAYSYLC